VAGLDAHHTAHDFHDALQQQQAAGQRDHELEGVDRQRRGAEGAFANRQGFVGKVPAGPGHGHHTGHEEQEVQDQVQRGLRAGPEKTVEHVTAHMPVLGQGVGSGQHEQRAVHHDLRVQCPVVRVVQRIARDHLPGDHERQRHDQPGKELAQPGREPVHQQ
jgi:hypothetical protein